MSVMAVGGIVFTCVFGGALLGMFLRTVLPEHHLSPSSQDLIKLEMGLVGTMAALVLGLLIASAKSSYDRLSDDLTQLSVKLILLDRVMAHYGPETMETRNLLRRSVVHALDGAWHENSSRPRRLEPVAGFGDLYDKIHELSPQNDAQRLRQGQALQLSTELAYARWLLVEQNVSSIPMPFVVLLTFWVMVIFVSFGLFAPPNITVIATLFICALSVSGAIFLILELDQPFEGLIQISNAPLRNALAHLGQ